MKDDDQLMYEAYVNSLLSEAPPIEITGDYNISDPAKEKSTQYKLSDKGLDLVIQHVIRLFPEGGPLELESDLGELTPKKVSKWLREEIKAFTVPRAKEADDEGLIFPAASQHTYFSRVIANDMLNAEHGEPFIAITSSGKLEVDPDQAENVKDDIKADIINGDPSEDIEDTPTVFDRNTHYNIDPLASETLPRQHRDVADYAVSVDGGTGQEIIDDIKVKIMFNNPVPAGGFGGSESNLINVLSELLAAGVLIPVEGKSEDDEVQDIDMSDPHDTSAADKEYIDQMVRQAEWGHAKPSLGLED